MNHLEIITLFAPLFLSPLVWREREPMPLPRAGYIAGVVDGKMLIAGGSLWEGDKKLLSARTDLFDPEQNRWIPGPPLPAPRSDVACVSSGKAVYVFGGVVNGALTDSVLRYEGGAWRELPEAKLPQPRMYAVAATAGDAIYVFGGLSTMGDLSSATRTLWRWNPHTGWRTMAEFPGTPRVIGALASAEGKLYYFGGLHKGAGDPKNLDELWRFDPAANTWTQLPNLPVARRAWSALSVGKGILLLGGYTDNFSAETYFFDPRAGKTVRHGDLLHPLADAKYVRIGDRLLTAGGEAGVKIRAQWTLESIWKENGR